MKDLHTFAWYAARISPHMPKEAFKPVPNRLWGGLIYVSIWVTGILMIAFLDLNFWTSLLLAFIIGNSFAGTCFLGHEILHGTVVRNPILRDLFGGIAFMPLTTGPALWRKWHNMTHHKHTQNEEHDPDSWATLEDLSKRHFLRILYRIPQRIRSISFFCFLMINFSLHSNRMFFKFIADFRKEKRLMVWMQWIISWGVWLGLLVWIGPERWLFAYLIPALIANVIMSSYVATNHNLSPLVPINDPLANSLSVTVPKWMNILHFNFSYHAEHHIFPGMNPKYYPLVKEHIIKMWPDRYFEMPFWKALLTLWRTPRVYYQKHEVLDVHANHAYGTLGKGLNPEKVIFRKIEDEQ